MPVHVPRGPGPDADDGVREYVAALERFVADHPGAVADVYRLNKYTARIRVISDSFRGRSRGDRHRFVWSYLEPLSEELLSDLSIVLLLTPEEQAESIGSLEFDHPEPALL